MQKHLISQIAVSIILSGKCADAPNNADYVVYGREIVHDLLGSNHQVSDQKMVRVNLALKNNADTAVRVVHIHESTNYYC